MRDRLVTVLLVVGFSVGIVALVWGIPASIMENRAEATEKSSLEARVYDLQARVALLEQRSLPVPSEAFGAFGEPVSALNVTLHDGLGFQLVCMIVPVPVDGPTPGMYAIMNCARVPNDAEFGTP